MFNQTTHLTYSEALAHAQLKSPVVAQSTTVAWDIVADEYFVSEDMLSGFAITDKGELVGVFSLVKGRGDNIMTVAKHRGATFLDHFDVPRLNELYTAHGFIEVGSVANWNEGGPRVVFRALKD